MDYKILFVVFIFIVLIFLAVRPVNNLFDDRFKTAFLVLISAGTFAIFGLLFTNAYIMTAEKSATKKPEQEPATEKDVVDKTKPIGLTKAAKAGPGDNSESFANEPESFISGPDEDLFEFSKYQNVNTDQLDSMKQRVLGMGEEIDNNANTGIDHSDLVDAVISGGSSYFQPIGQGVSTTSSAEESVFNLEQPAADGDGEYNMYDIGITSAPNMDELLARKQQHRANMNKKAIDGRVRSTRNIYEKYFNNELNENEHRVWWSSEAVDLETDFRPW